MWRRYFSDGAALMRLGFTGFAAQMGRGRAIAGNISVETDQTAGQTVIRVSGVACHGSLKSVREAFRAAAARGKPVRLDLSATEAVDRAFLGQVLMLEKHLDRAGAGISLEGANARIDALFRANNMNYVRIAAGAQNAPEMAAMRKAAV